VEGSAAVHWKTPRPQKSVRRHPGSIVASIAGLAAAVAVLGACTAQQQPAPQQLPRTPGPSLLVSQLVPAPGVSGQPENGRSLFLAKGCPACHTLQGVPSASGAVGPNLTNISLRPTLAGETIQNSPATMARWIVNPAAVKSDAKMPALGLTDQEAQDVMAFLWSQPYNPVR
jgi:cytochrome c1